MVSSLTMTMFWELCFRDLRRWIPQELVTQLSFSLLVTLKSIWIYEFWYFFLQATYSPDTGVNEKELLEYSYTIDAEMSYQEYNKLMQIIIMILQEKKKWEDYIKGGYL